MKGSGTNAEAGASLREAVRATLLQSTQPLSPAEIRDRIKSAYPHLFATDSQRAGVERGSYQNLDHALLSPIYSMVINSADFVVDRSSKPMRVALATDDGVETVAEENYESDVGIVYVLSTGMFTAQGRRVLKIGYTTQALPARIAQLYTTGTAFQFEELHSWRTKNYVELEQAIHKLMAPFRLSRAREFFSDEALEFVEQIVSLHNGVLSLAKQTHPAAAIDAVTKART